MWLRRRLADFFVLRPSRDAIDDPQPASQAWIDGPFGRIECFAARKLAGGHMPVPLECDSPLTDAPPIDGPLADLLILKLPGTGGRAQRSTIFPATLLPELDVEIWTWNPPGYGRSEGHAAIEHFPDSVLAVWDYLTTNRCGPNTRTIIAGNSLGSAAALFLASKRESDGLFVRNPPSLVRLVRRGDAWWNCWFGGTWISSGIDARMNAERTAAQCKSRAVFIQSELDRLTTPPLQKLIIDAYAGSHRVVVLDGADHSTPYEERDFPAIESGLRWMLDGRRDSADAEAKDY